VVSIEEPQMLGGSTRAERLIVDRGWWQRAAMLEVCARRGFGHSEEQD
jgi:hypothetical protein